MGQRVLLVDADPQQSLSHVYPINTLADAGLLQLYHSANATSTPNLDIILMFHTETHHRISARALRQLSHLYTDRTGTTSNITVELRSMFDQAVDNQVTVLNTVIPLLKPYSEANGRGIPVHRYEIARSGPTRSAFYTMLALIEELEPKLMGTKPQWINN